MRKNKFVYTLSALMMACIVSFSGIGNSYIQAHATSVGIEPGVWNDDASAWENIRQYLQLFASAIGVYVSPNISTALWGADACTDFYNFMISDGVSHDVAHGVFCDCDDSSHTSFSGQEHGGGGHVRDGISVDEDGNVTYSDEVSDLFHGYIQDYIDSQAGYIYVKTKTLKYSDIYDNLYFKNGHYDYYDFAETIENIFEKGYLACVYFSSAYDNRIGYLDYDRYVIAFWSGGKLPLSVDSAYLCKMDLDGKRSYKVDSTDDLNFNFPMEFDDFDFSVGFDYFCIDTITDYTRGVYSPDGRYIKIWLSREAYRLSLEEDYQMPYYVTQSWNSYNSADDNSVTLTQQEYQYFSDNSSTMYETIQNNIDNSTEGATEQNIQNIVNNTYNYFVEESTKTDSGSSGDDSGIKPKAPARN